MKILKKIILWFSIINIAMAHHHHHHHHYRHHHRHFHHVKNVKRHNINKVAYNNQYLNMLADEPNNNSYAKDNSQLFKGFIEKIGNKPRLNSFSALVVDPLNKIIYINKNINVQLPIASISKLMTAMVVLDAKPDLDKLIEISSQDKDYLRNTKSSLHPGLEFKRHDLLLLALMSSENRAAHALARTTFDSGINKFIEKMNSKAKELSMTNTVFHDPTGLITTNQSTASDLYRMVNAAVNYDLIKKFTEKKFLTVKIGNRYIHYMNTDSLVRAGKLNIIISKTGFINEAGHCLVLYTMINENPIIMIFLKSNGKNDRIIDALNVVNYIKRNKSSSHVL